MDKTTGKPTSLHTTNEDEAQEIIEAKNNSVRQTDLAFLEAENVDWDSHIISYARRKPVISESVKRRESTPGTWYS